MNGSKGFMLNNSLAATSALLKSDNIYAADGKEFNVHVFDPCGSFLNKICTARAYRRLRYDAACDGFTALGCDCNRRLYCIDGNFNELGYTRLSTECSRSSVVGAMTDASSVSADGRRFFVAAFERAAFLFDSGGTPIRQLCKAECHETITDFISFGEERFAFGTRNGKFTVITVSDNGKTQSAVLDSNLSLRMLFAVDGCVYGLFGYAYIYNRICPIYTNGSLSMPKAIENRYFPC